MQHKKWIEAQYDIEKDVLIVAGITREQYSYYERMQAELYGNILIPFNHTVPSENQDEGRDNERFDTWMAEEAEKQLQNHF